MYRVLWLDNDWFDVDTKAELDEWLRCYPNHVKKVVTKWVDKYELV